MLAPARLIAIREKLGLPQEHMARLLGVSFASVNRWEQGHTAPTGPTLDLYLALTPQFAQAMPLEQSFSQPTPSEVCS